MEEGFGIMGFERWNVEMGALLDKGTAWGKA